MNWPLNINNFNFWDKIRIASFILDRKNKWTQNTKVIEFEKLMAEYVGSKYAVFVSSGSTANMLMAQYVKDSSKHFAKKNLVIFPSTTWQTSYSPWIREGFEPHFIDVSMEDLSIDKVTLENFVVKNQKKIACIFPTSLIGFSPDMGFYQRLQDKYGVRVYFDNCENTLGEFNQENVSSYFTSSTSTYFGHQLQSIEGGFIFTNSKEEFEYFLMQRNHGMTRSLAPYGVDDTKYRNDSVDALFDFYSLGNNFRSTDLNAFIGILDFNRINKYKEKRINLYKIFKESLDKDKFYFCEERLLSLDVPFCLPIISKHSNKSEIIKLCQSLGIEYRPIVSGFLGYQTCVKEYFSDHSNYPNSIFLHNNGTYVGIHSQVKVANLLELADKLNKI